MKPRKILWSVGAMIVGIAVPVIALLSDYAKDPEVSWGRFVVRDNAAWTILILISAILWGMLGVGTAALLDFLQRKPHQ